MTRQDTSRPPQTFLHKVAGPADRVPDEPDPAEPAPVDADLAAPAPANDAETDEAAADDAPADHAETEPISMGRVPAAPVPAAPVPAAPVPAPAVPAPAVPAPTRPAGQAPAPPSREAPAGPLAGPAADDLRARWRQAASGFVDDPPTALETAGGIVRDAVALLQEAVREQQRELGAGGADTEALRQAMLGYRRFLDALLR